MYKIGVYSGDDDDSFNSIFLYVTPASVEYPRIDNIPRTTAFDDTDFNMTCTVSGSGVVKLQWLKDGVSIVNSDLICCHHSPSDRRTVHVWTNGRQEQYIGLADDKEREVFHL